MEKSANYNFNLPNSANDEIADINDISDNFRIIDEKLAIDQTFSETSENPQSGTAIAEVLSGYVSAEVGKGLSSNDYTDEEKEKLAGIEEGAEVNAPVDTTYNPESANAQSGIAVAQAVDACSPAIVTASDTGKALAINDSSESVIRGLTGYGESTQDGTPAPDSPVEIVSVENPVIHVYGKNLYKNTLLNEWVEDSNSYYYYLDLKSGTYNLSIVVGTYNYYGYFYVQTSSNEDFSSHTNYILLQGTNKKAVSISFTVSETEKARLYFLSSTSYDANSIFGQITNIQLEVGSVATSYEPYIEPQTVTIPYTFRGLKNSNAGWFVRDEVVVDVKSQAVKIIKRLLERVIDGTENWNGSTSGSKYLVTGDKAKGTGNVISNRFKRGYDEGRVPGEISGTVTNSAVFVMYTEDITVSDFKSMLAEWYASGNPMVMVYVLETPTETDITATETGQALLALKSNYPSTSVISDIDLNITYKADTKNYIDNKIAALTALTLEG